MPPIQNGRMSLIRCISTCISSNDENRIYHSQYIIREYATGIADISIITWPFYLNSVQSPTSQRGFLAMHLSTRKNTCGERNASALPEPEDAVKIYKYPHGILCYFQYSVFGKFSYSIFLIWNQNMGDLTTNPIVSKGEKHEKLG